MSFKTEKNNILVNLLLFNIVLITYSLSYFVVEKFNYATEMLSNISNENNCLPFVKSLLVNFLGVLIYLYCLKIICCLHFYNRLKVGLY